MPAFDLTLRGNREPLLLSRIVRVLAWQGIVVRGMHTRADADCIVLTVTVEGDEGRVARLLKHFRRIRGVDHVEALDAETGEAQNATQPTVQVIH